MYNDFKFKNYKQTNHKIRQLREMVDRLYGDVEYKKNLISELNSQLKIKINLPSEANLPDLTITNITSIDKGHYFEFTITIKNIGEIATTEETNLVITIEEEEVELIVPALAVDATVDRYTSFPYDPDAVDTYSLNVNSEVNEERNIEESDYSNNIKNQSFIIKENYNQGYFWHVHNEEGIEINSIRLQLIFPSGSFSSIDGLFDSSSIGSAPSTQEEHNVFTSVPSVGLYALEIFQVITGSFYQIKNISVTTGPAINNIFILIRETTPVLSIGGNDYKFLTISPNGNRFGIANYTGFPIALFDDIDGYTYCSFADSQPNITAITVPYDFLENGVRG